MEPTEPEEPVEPTDPEETVEPNEPEEPEDPITEDPEEQEKPVVKPPHTTNWKAYDYFKARKDTQIFDNNFTPLKPVGKILMGQEYKIKRDYGKNWHELQYGDIDVFVNKKDTTPANGARINNANTKYKVDSGNFFITKRRTAVYDNSSGKLVPFAYLNPGEKYPISKDYGGNWWRIVIFDRVGYVHKDDVFLNGQYNWKDYDYFTATTAATVYDNRYTPLKPIGKLVPGEEYKIKRDYGKNWHEIQYADINAYIKKDQTVPSEGSSLSKLSNSTDFLEEIRANKDISVYDNSGYKLKPFATINAGEKYKIKRDYGGNWWEVVYANRLGYIDKREVSLIFDWADYDYFKVINDTSIYDNRFNPLKPIGKLVPGQEYKIKRNYGKNWHEIQYGDIDVYVNKKDTTPSNGSKINNANTKYKVDSGNFFITKRRTAVYDNSSGKLVPFAYLNPGEKYPISKDYGGNWWRIVVFDRVAYVKKDDVFYNGQYDWKDYDYFTATTAATVYDNRFKPLKPVAELVKGQEYKIKRDYGENWHEIQFGDFNGYIHKDDTRPALGDSIKNNNDKFTEEDVIAKIIAPKKAPVYDNSKVKLEPFAYLYPGTEYKIVQNYGNNWWAVVVADRIGYVRKSDVNLNTRKIYIDAGHGGADSGAVNGDRHEADDALALAKQIQKDFEEELQVTKISRDDDSYLELSERTDGANNWGADIMVSIHRNAAPMPEANGIEVWLHTKYRDKPNSKHVIAARNALNNLEKLGFRNRGVKFGYTSDPDANLYINNHANMPSMLFEVGFITNPYDNYLFDHKLAEISKAIVEGILSA